MDNNALNCKNLSKNIISLFESLLTRNTEGAIENMDKIQASSISPELITSIKNDINTYIQGVSQIKLLEDKIDGAPETTKPKVLDKNKK